MFVSQHTKRQVLYLNALENNIDHRCLCYTISRLMLRAPSKGATLLDLTFLLPNSDSNNLSACQQKVTDVDYFFILITCLSQHVLGLFGENRSRSLPSFSDLRTPFVRERQITFWAQSRKFRKNNPDNIIRPRYKT